MSIWRSNGSRLWSVADSDRCFDRLRILLPVATVSSAVRRADCRSEYRGIDVLSSRTAGCRNGEERIALQE